MKAKVVATALFIVSEVSLQDLTALQKYNPDVLTLCEGENENRKQVFKMAAGEPSFNQFGFTADRMEDKKAMVVVALPKAADSNPAKYVEDTYGVAIRRMNALEKQIAAYVNETMAAELEEVRSAISVEEI